MKTPEQLCDIITDYLGNGGLWNPEFMEHNKVRDLLIDCREFLRSGMVPVAELRPTIDIIKNLLLSADCSWYQSGGGHDWKGAVDVATSEIARLETLLGENQPAQKDPQ